jgi:hypothetical protein
MSARDILPAHGAMTAEQLHGFRIACACMATWGRQLHGGGGAMAGHGRFMAACAHTLDTQLGQGALPSDPASLAPEALPSWVTL